MFMNVHIQSETAFTCTAVKQIMFKNVVIDTKNGPAMVIRHSENVDTAGLSTLMPHAGVPLVQEGGPAAPRN